MTLAVVWLLTLVNCLGVRAAGWVQAVTTVLKLMPLVAIGIVGLFFVRGDLVSAHAGVPLSLDATTAAATLTLWALLGLESATVPADKVRGPGADDPARDARRDRRERARVRARVQHRAGAGARRPGSPPRTRRSRTRPRSSSGRAPAALVAVFAAISAYGALNGWILLQGELPCALARDGLFPRAFGRLSRRGTPGVRPRLDEPARERCSC